MYSIAQELGNKQSAKVICWFDKLRTAHSKRQKAIGKLSAAHIFDYIVLRANPALTNCEDLPVALHSSPTKTH